MFWREVVSVSSGGKRNVTWSTESRKARLVLSPAFRQVGLHPTSEAFLARTEDCRGPYFVAVKRTVVLYGVVAGLFVALLRLVEYRFLVVEHALEIYGGIVALLFAGLGIWLGLKLTRTRVEIREVPVPVPAPAAESFSVDRDRQAQLGVTARELEILECMAAGLSTREIAEKLYVSENTVKTHTGRLFDKLGARRRTQAVQRAREARLIP